MYSVLFSTVYNRDVEDQNLNLSPGEPQKRQQSRATSGKLEGWWQRLPVAYVTGASNVEIDDSNNETRATEGSDDEA